ncbi:HNH endonuclease signature motif containing protein [Arthrobacter sp. SAFR-044]|uniref:HNH endonuclease signature motif containing protein n=1 Tax=Arthrobacter sp. SAFR-044 TaxID=3387278 RepID=UPI003F7B9A83
MKERKQMVTTTTATTTEELLMTTDDPIDTWLSPALQRFFRKTQGDWETGCWNWIAAKDKDNYARFWRNNGNRKAHRWIYEMMVGPIPAGLELDHVCVNARCVAPNHLEPVTKAENQRRKQFRKAEAAAGRPVRMKTGATTVQELTLAIALGLPTGGTVVLPARQGARAVRSTSPATFDTLSMSRMPRTS